MGSHSDDFVLTDELLTLSELFSDVPLFHIQHLLETSNNDIDSVAEQLFSYHLIKDDLDKICSEKENFVEKAVPEKPKEWVLVEPQEKTKEKPLGKSKRKEKRSRRGSRNKKDKEIPKTKEKVALNVTSKFPSSDNTNKRKNTDIPKSSRKHSFGESINMQPSDENMSNSNSSCFDNNSDTTSSMGSSNSTYDEEMEKLSNQLKASSIDELLENMKIEQLSMKFELRDTIKDLLNVDNNELVEYYLDRNNCDKLNTIYDIMLNYDDSVPKSDNTNHKIEEINFQWGVHRGGNSMSEVLKKKMKNITISDSDACWFELQTLIDANPQLELPNSFYLLAINWFDKDIDKVLNLAIVLNDCFDIKEKKKQHMMRQREREKELKKLNLQFLQGKEMDFTVDELKKLSELDKEHFDLYLSENNENSKHFDKNGFYYVDNKKGNQNNDEYMQNLRIMQWRVNNSEKVRNITNDKRLKAYYSTNIGRIKEDIYSLHHKAQRSEIDIKIEIAKSQFRIDFHDTSVQNAVYALREVLEYWWNVEMETRNIHNTRFEFTKIVHVEPFKIITGRGLHSGGGIAKIKNATIKFLTENKYKYEDKTAAILVVGKGK